jgi:3-dehydroquinate dehydratase I
MFCVSIAEPNYTSCLKAIEGEKLCEIRLDLIPLTEDEVRKLFSQPAQLIATYRPLPDNEELRKKILKIAIESGAAMVDLEVENSPEFNAEMVEFARKHNCRVIISYHNYQETPKLAELKQIEQQCYAAGANIAKIASQANSVEDAARLLGMYDDKKEKVIIGMGNFGKITRIAALKLGAPFTFVAKDEKTATAPGQFVKETAAEILRFFE